MAVVEVGASTAAVAVEAFTAADLAADSTEVVSGDITQDGVELAGVAVGAVMAGAEAGADTVGAAGVTQDGVTRAGESVWALVGDGVRIGRVIRMPMAIPITPTIRTPMAILTIRIIHIMGRRRMPPPIRMGITVAIKIRMTTWSDRIRVIAGRKDRPT